MLSGTKGFSVFPSEPSSWDQMNRAHFASSLTFQNLEFCVLFDIFKQIYFDLITPKTPGKENQTSTHTGLTNAPFDPAQQNPPAWNAQCVSSISLVFYVLKIFILTFIT